MPAVYICAYMAIHTQIPMSLCLEDTDIFLNVYLFVIRCNESVFFFSCVHWDSLWQDNLRIQVSGYAET
jgi:hypothetical protein